MTIETTATTDAGDGSTAARDAVPGVPGGPTSSGVPGGPGADWAGARAEAAVRDAARAAARVRARVAAAVAGPAARLDPRRLPPWAQALLVYGVSRFFVTWVAQRCADMAAPHPGGRHWNYLEIANNWDGTWYERISVEGYPAHLPHDRAGAVAQNTWAFYPLFPNVVHTVERSLGIGWTLAATIVSLTCALVTAVVVRSLVARVAGPRAGLWTVALLFFFPSSLVLQLPYSEGLGLLLLVGVLWCLQRGRYLAATPLILLVGVARPLGVPLAAVLGVHLLARAWDVRAEPRLRAARSLAGPLVAAAAGVVAAVEWPLIVWWGTGVRSGYTRTMAAWRSTRTIVPVEPSIEVSRTFLGQQTGPLLVWAAVGGVVLWLLLRGRWAIGLDLTVWCLAYSVYLLIVLDSFTSLPRYLLPLFPLGTLLLSTSRSRAFRIALTVSFAMFGVVWTIGVWRSHTWAP